MARLAGTQSVLPVLFVLVSVGMMPGCGYSPPLLGDAEPSAKTQSDTDQPAVSNSDATDLVPSITTSTAPQSNTPSDCTADTTGSDAPSDTNDATCPDDDKNDDGDTGDDTGANDDPACPVLTGFGTNPGPGTGPVTITLRYVGASGQVKCHPTIPGFDNVEVALGLDGENTITFSNSPDQISLGAVVFVAGSNETAVADDLVLQRGIDYACGQSITLTFEPPCGIALDIP
ncbi:MAG: hypothetical protein JXQ73_30350 [Phycisphaerae bacterium]|nr:hypothetical protein [Phycisphaerae bacterium]